MCVGVSDEEGVDVGRVLDNLYIVGGLFGIFWM